MRRVQIGVMGSAGLSIAPEQLKVYEEICEKLGRAIAECGAVLVTGETNGIPSLVLAATRRAGGLTVGISPAHNRDEQERIYQMPLLDSDIVIFTGFGLKGRNLINIRSADIVIIVAGSIGTLNEFTIAYDEGKIIGVLAGTGGVADELPSLLSKLNKPTAARVVYDTDPAQLIAKTVAFARPSL